MVRVANRENQRGLSLNELLLLLVVGAALTAIALPSYRLYAFKTHRSMAAKLMRSIGQQQERWFLRNQHYTSLLTLGYPAPVIYVGTDGLAQGAATAQSIYRISLATSADAVASCKNPQGSGGTDKYLIIAQPIQAQAPDTLCATLCMNEAGQIGSSGSNTPKACWGP